MNKTSSFMVRAGFILLFISSIIALFKTLPWQAAIAIIFLFANSIRVQVSRVKQGFDLPDSIKELMKTPMKGFSKDDKTDMEILHTKLEEAGIEHLYRKHPALVKEPQVLELLGFSPAGTHQIVINEDSTDRMSIIRGAVSFGMFEIYGNGYEAERFETEDEVVEAVKAKMPK